jgi:molybdopterin converting factor small subunit
VFGFVAHKIWNNAMRVNIKIFGPLRDVIQHDELSLELPPPHTGEHAYEILAGQHPALHNWRPSVRLAVNLEYTSFEHELKSGDEVSLIPPVSGG